MRFKTMHLFAGAGGGLLADLILGHTPVVAVEWNSYVCRALRERAAEGWFPELSVWEGDVREFDPAEYAGIVDVIHAGFPCQDISAAGSQAGIGGGTRSGLYREVLRIARVVRPRIIFLENVAAITSRKKDYLEVIAKDLAEIGYDARWICLSAADVGANHKRERWWCMCRHVADPDRMRELQPKRIKQNQRGRIGYGGEDVADAECVRLEGIGEQKKINRKKYQVKKRGPTPRTVTERIRRNYWYEVESRVGGVVDGVADGMGGNWWGVEPGIPRVTTRIKDRADRLKALGNGQVPLQAAVAWRILMETLEEGIGQPHPFAIYKAVDWAIAELSKDKSQ